MDYDIKDFGVMDNAAHAAGSSTVYLVGDGTDQMVIKRVEGCISGQSDQEEDEHNVNLERMEIRKICGLDGLHAVTGTNDLPMRNSSAYGKGLTIPPASESLPHPSNTRIGGDACHTTAPSRVRSSRRATTSPCRGPTSLYGNDSFGVPI